MECGGLRERGVDGGPAREQRHCLCGRQVEVEGEHRPPRAPKPTVSMEERASM